jgi:hypothetical protein
MRRWGNHAHIKHAELDEQEMQGASTYHSVHDYMYDYNKLIRTAP